MAIVYNTIQPELQAIGVVSAGLQGIGSTFATSGQLLAFLFIDFAPISTTTPTKGTEFRVQVSHGATGNDKWRNLPGGSFLTGIGVATQFALDATNAAGAQTILESVTTSLAVDDRLFFWQPNSVGLSEWGRVAKLQASSFFTLVDSLTNAQNSGNNYYNTAEHFLAQIDLGGVVRLRPVCNNAYQGGTVGNVVWRCALITCDSIGG